MPNITLVKASKLYDPAAPHRDKSLKSLKGERWEDIPGVDGYYLISNYGKRVFLMTCGKQ